MRVHLADKDGIVKFHKSVELSKAKVVDAPIKTSNRLKTSRKDTYQAGPRKEATPSAQPKAKIIPPIVAKVKKVETSVINAVRAQTSGLWLASSTRKVASR